MISPVKIWRNQKKIARLVGERGTVVSWTMVYVPLGPLAHLAPYPVAVVRLASGGRVFVQVVDYAPEQLKAGQEVRLVIRRVTDPGDEGVIPYSVKARPI